MATTTPRRRKPTRGSASSRAGSRSKPPANRRPKAPAPLPCQDCGWAPPPGGLWPSLGGLAVRWISENLIFPEGDTLGEPFALRDDQKLFLYRWYEYCPDCEHWRYDEGVRGAATGDGKTTFIAAIALLEFAGPPQLVPNTPIVNIAAAKFDQADELFRKAGQMVGGQDDEITEAPLCGFFYVYDTEIHFRDGRPGVIKRIAAAAGTNEGGLPHLFIADEVHEWGDVGSNKARVHTVVGKSTKKRRTRRGPGRILNLSTAGFDVDHSLLGAMYKQGKRALHNPKTAPKLLFDWQEAPDGLNYNRVADRRKAVKAASQAAGVLWNVEDRVRDWGKPSMPRHEWIRYYANRWVEVTEESWLKDHPTAWAECQGNAKIPRRSEVKVAVDMALKRDSVAVLVGWQRPDGRVAVRARIWRPDGGKIDHLEVVDYIRHELADEFTIVEIAYDPRFFEVPARLLEDEGFNLVEFPQSIERMTPACGEARPAILSKLVVHDGDPDLAAHVNAAVERPNERGFTLSKGKSRKKIDACIALVIVLWRIFAPDEEEEDVEPWVEFA